MCDIDTTQEQNLRISSTRTNKSIFEFTTILYVKSCYKSTDFPPECQVYLYIGQSYNWEGLNWTSKTGVAIDAAITPHSKELSERKLQGHILNPVCCFDGHPLMTYVGNGAICSTKLVLFFFCWCLSGGRPTGCSNNCVHSLGYFVDRVLFYKVVQ